MGLYLESLAHENPYLTWLEKSPLGWVQTKLFEVFFLLLTPVSLVWFAFASMLANVLSLLAIFVGIFYTVKFTLKYLIQPINESVYFLLLSYLSIIESYTIQIFIGLFFVSYAISILQIAPFEQTKTNVRNTSPNHPWGWYLFGVIGLYISSRPSVWFDTSILTVLPLLVTCYVYIHFSVLEQLRIDYQNPQFPYYKAELWLITILGSLYAGILTLYLLSFEVGYYLIGFGLAITVVYRLYRNYIVKQPESQNVTMSDHYTRKTPTSSEMDSYIRSQIDNHSVDQSTVDGESYHDVLLGMQDKEEWIEEYTASDEAIKQAEEHNEKLLTDIEFAWEEFTAEAFKQSESPELQVPIKSFKLEHIEALKSLVVETLEDNEDATHYAEKASKRLLQILNTAINQWKRPEDFED